MDPALRTMRLMVGAALSILCGLVAAGASRAADPAIDSVMYADPEIPSARLVPVFPERLTSLWLRALERPESDLKCQAAASIAEAHRRGMSGLQATVAPLLRVLDAPGQNSTARLAAAQALIALDARSAAAGLFAHAQADGIEMRNLVDPALARWDYAPARVAWLERLDQSGIPRRGGVIAIQCLGTVRETRAVPKLRELTRSPSADPILRLEAARALGAIQTSGLEKEAERLLAEPTPPGSVARLAAAWLLRRHRGDEAVRILQRLAGSAEPAAATVALDGLLEIDSRLVLPVMRPVLASPDAKVRAQGIEAHRRQASAEHIPLVAELLNDPHPAVRASARKALAELARKEGHREAVIAQAMKLLGGDRWRALEQATILLGGLDHKSAAGRFVELLRSDRPEVFLAAAWGLRKLAVADTLPAQLGEIERRWQRSLKMNASDPRAWIDREVSQLAQSLGAARYAPAGPALERFIPKQANIGPESRAAAIWALGLMHEKSPPPALIEDLLDRVTDDSTTVVEDPRVRRMAAVSLGRMKAKEAVTALRKYYPKKLTAEQFPNACGWALEQITGERLPRTGTVDVPQKGWFLEPTG